MESNAFKTADPTVASQPVVTLGTTAAGLLAVGAAFVAQPFGPTFITLSWAFVLGGVALALCPGRARWLGTGLAFAGAAMPVAMFVWTWIALSAFVLWP